MRIKQRPEDFVVKESYRFEPSQHGPYRVYLMDKQKLSTYEAVDRLRRRFDLPSSAFSYCGLKDKQGRTEQLLAVRGAEVAVQEPDLRLKYLGRAGRPLSAANITSNRFSVTVRDLCEEDLAKLPRSVAEVHRLGVINYFDSQRFGSIKHGQGFIAKDLIRGEFESALRSYLAQPSPLDATTDAKVKAFYRDHWGDWSARCPYPTDRYREVLRHLRQDPKDFRGAFLRIETRYRAMQLFAYQSFLWNEGVRRYLIQLLPQEWLIPVRYQMGVLLFPSDAPLEVLETLRAGTFPLLAPDSPLEDEQVRKAVEWVLGREKLKLSDLQVPGTPELFFKHEERPLSVMPGKLVVGKPERDELGEERLRVNVAFTLPPGAYATLVIKRLFWFAAVAEPRRAEVEEGLPAPKPPKPAPEAPREPAPGFLEKQRRRKAAKALARTETKQSKKPRKK